MNHLTVFGHSQTVTSSIARLGSASLSLPRIAVRAGSKAYRPTDDKRGVGHEGPRLAAVATLQARIAPVVLEIADCGPIEGDAHREACHGHRRAEPRTHGRREGGDRTRLRLGRRTTVDGLEEAFAFNRQPAAGYLDPWSTPSSRRRRHSRAFRDDLVDVSRICVAPRGRCPHEHPGLPSLAQLESAASRLVAALVLADAPGGA